MNRVSLAFPATNIFFPLGNTDACEGDYSIRPGRHFLQDTSKLISEKFFKEAEMKSLFFQGLLRGRILFEIRFGS